MRGSFRREALRVIDANFNRSREGLRVCEDIARFVMNSGTLASELKEVRHGVSEVLKKINHIAALRESRDSRGDVGRFLAPHAEPGRRDIADIFEANMERVKESLRVLEEFFKLIDIRHSEDICILRFRVYDIEKRSFRRIAAIFKHT